jgi:hypothetical protein
LRRVIGEHLFVDAANSFRSHRESQPIMNLSLFLLEKIRCADADSARIIDAVPSRSLNANAQEQMHHQL